MWMLSGRCPSLWLMIAKPCSFCFCSVCGLGMLLDSSIALSLSHTIHLVIITANTKASNTTAWMQTIFQKAERMPCHDMFPFHSTIDPFLRDNWWVSSFCISLPRSHRTVLMLQLHLFLFEDFIEFYEWEKPKRSYTLSYIGYFEFYNDFKFEEIIRQEDLSLHGAQCTCKFVGPGHSIQLRM